MHSKTTSVLYSIEKESWDPKEVSRHYGWNRNENGLYFLFLVFFYIFSKRVRLGWNFDFRRLERSNQNFCVSLSPAMTPLQRTSNFYHAGYAHRVEMGGYVKYREYRSNAIFAHGCKTDSSLRQRQHPHP